MEVKRFILSNKKQIIDTEKEKDYIVNKEGEIAKVVVLNDGKKKIVLAGKLVKTGDNMIDLLEDEDVIKSSTDNFMYYVWQYKMNKGGIINPDEVELAYKMLPDSRLILFYKKEEKKNDEQ